MVRIELLENKRAELKEWIDALDEIIADRFGCGKDTTHVLGRRIAYRRKLRDIDELLQHLKWLEDHEREIRANQGATNGQ